MVKRALTLEQERELVSLYLSGESSKTLCERYNLKSTETIRNIIRRQGAKVRKVGKCNVKYNVNHQYFSNGITTEASARLLGLLLTDGSLHHRYVNNKLLHFGSTDKSLSEFVHSQLGGSILETTTSVGTPYYRVTITSESLFNALVEFGFSPNKSKTIELAPGVVTHALRYAFLVGLVEGDGSILKRRTSIATRVEFCTGSDRFASQFIAMFPEFHAVHKPGIHVFYLGITENPAIRSFFEDFYSCWTRLNALERKGKVMKNRLQE